MSSSQSWLSSLAYAYTSCICNSSLKQVRAEREKFVIAHARRQLPDGAELTQLIDNHVLEMVVNDQMYRLESLVINSYDHLLDIRGTKRNKSAIEIAEIKQLTHIVRFLSELDKYKVRYVPRPWGGQGGYVPIVPPPPEMLVMKIFNVFKLVR